MLHRNPVVRVFLLAMVLAGAAGAAVFNVDVRSNFFSPETVTIAVGDTVTWTNRGGSHNVRADDGSFFNGPPSSSAWTFSRRFDTAGTFQYYCEPHGGPNGLGMSGRVVVVAPAQNGTLSIIDSVFTVRENAGRVNVAISRIGGADGAVSVRFETVAGTASEGGDFGGATTIVSWGNGDAATKTVEVPIHQDDVTESDESFTVRITEPVGGARVGDPATATVTIRDDDFVPIPCVVDDQTLCLVDGRFRVRAHWMNQFNNTSGSATAVPRTSLSGFFYFTEAENPELMIKIVDFGDVIKVFYGQLTDLHFEITVFDVTTGEEKIYGNGPEDCGAIDQAAFQKSGIDRRALARQLRKPRSGKAGNCVASPTRLCLNNNRYAVEVTWRNHFNGDTGVGGAAPYSELAGTFSFTDPANVELMAKVLDFGQILFLWGALSDLEYHLTLTDTVTGVVNRYDNPGGKFCGGKDTDAF